LAAHVTPSQNGSGRRDIRKKRSRSDFARNRATIVAGASGVSPRIDATGTGSSRTKTLEQKGWSGICVDPYPKNMLGRTCQVVKQVVSDESGKKVTFFAHPASWVASSIR